MGDCIARHRANARPTIEKETRERLDQLFGLDWKELDQKTLTPIRVAKEHKQEMREIAREASLADELLLRERLPHLRDFVPNPLNRAELLYAYAREYRKKAAPLVRRFPTAAIPEAKASIERTVNLLISEANSAAKEAKRQSKEAKETKSPEIIQSVNAPASVRPIEEVEGPDIDVVIDKLLSNSSFRNAVMLKTKKRNQPHRSPRELLRDPGFLDRPDIQSLAHALGIGNLFSKLKSKIRH